MSNQDSENITPEEPVSEDSGTPDSPAMEETTGEGAMVTTGSPPQAQPGPTPLTPSEEHTWALIAHLSILVNLITFFLGPIIALIIYLVFRERSRYVAYQSFQAFLFQLIFWVGGSFLVAITWTLVGILTAVIVGLCLIPLACAITLIPVFALGYGIAGAIQAGQGVDFKYWLVGDWTRDLIQA
jgi:uncharacterized Tic20 family protein